MNQINHWEAEDQYFMGLALQQASLASIKDEIPVGCVIVVNNEVLASAHNAVEQLQHAHAHAELLALTQAMDKLNNKYLTTATLYTTLEPCLMCCGACYWSKLKRVVFGAEDIKNGGLSFYKNNGIKVYPLHPKTTITSGILAEPSKELLQSFFKKKRKK
ncbi:MAG: nucleoside deaminase [Phycisphaerales bacterium]|nr:nucleoside deaminase [Phycisphaerales bacterium]